MFYWTITKDVLGDEPQSVGVSGGNPKAKHHLDAVSKSFRLLDDDGKVYYEGVFYCTKDEVNSETGFSPLDDYGMPNAGCTEIQYWNFREGWVTL